MVMEEKNTGLNYNGSYISDEVRSRYISASIGPDRRVLDNPASSQWSLLGRMLKEFNERLSEETISSADGHTVTKAEAFKQSMQEIRDQILFSITDQDGTNLMGELSRIMQQETANQLNCSPNDLTVDLNAYDPWNLYKTLQIFVTEQETGVRCGHLTWAWGCRQASL